MTITDNIHYVGVNDRRAALFEGLWPLPDGISYNAYLVDDTGKTALIDTVEPGFFSLFLKKIRAVLKERPIDYLIINHMEPDHSGSIALIRKHYPRITLVGNRRTLEMAAGFYGESGPSLCVSEKEELSLGKYRLSFHLTPMVHWPETMMTFESTSGALFSGDAFGCFGALSGAVKDCDMNTALFIDEMRRYYSNIVGKYGMPVQSALKKLSGFHIKMICPAHGPVWEKQAVMVTDEYRRMSLYEAEEGAVIAYGSMYGNTEEMAETAAEALAGEGIKNIVMHNLSKSHISYVLSDLFRYRGLLIGSPTYNHALFPPVEELLRETVARGITGRCMGCFGSFAWAGVLTSEMEKWNEKLRFECVGKSVENKQGVDFDTMEACRILGKAMAEKLKEMR